MKIRERKQHFLTYRRDMARRTFRLRLRFSPVFTNYKINNIFKSLILSLEEHIIAKHTRYPLWFSQWFSTSSHTFTTQYEFTAHSVPSAIQLFPLPSQLSDDICAYLLRLRCNALASFNTLAGIVQRLCALQQQSSLRLQVCLNRSKW